MQMMRLGVLATSSKENESRLPIHPQHLDRIDEDLRTHLFLERGYGERYGVSDAHLATRVAGIHSRAEILASADVVLLPKPTLDDLHHLRVGRCCGAGPTPSRTPI